MATLNGSRITSINEAVVVSERDIDRALRSTRELAGDAADVASTEVVRRFADVLAHLSAGQVVTLVPEHAELNLSQVAELLDLSTSRVARLIAEGELAQSGTEARPRVRYVDAVAYKRRHDADREAAVVELTQLSQELGLY